MNFRLGILLALMFLVVASPSSAGPKFKRGKYFDLRETKANLELENNDKVMLFTQQPYSRSGNIQESYIMGFSESNKIIIPGQKITKKQLKNIAFEKSSQTDDIALGTLVYDKKKNRTGVVIGYFLNGSYLVKLSRQKIISYLQKYDYARWYNIKIIRVK